MFPHPLDDPDILSLLFHARKAQSGQSEVPHTYDGTITVGAEVEIGYRYYATEPGLPVILYFHGNGEIASDYDIIAPFYHVAGAGLLIIDYRGYGWSTGQPLASQMLPDAMKALASLPDILAQHDAQPVSLFVKGRSLGSAPAIYLAYRAPERFKGVMIDSGFADTPSLFKRLGLQLPDNIVAEDDLPLRNAAKLAQTHLPLLVLHGEEDQLLPVIHARELYKASPVAESDKELLIIERAGHNNLISTGMARYFDAVRRFLQRYA